MGRRVALGKDTVCLSNLVCLDFLRDTTRTRRTGVAVHFTFVSHHFQLAEDTCPIGGVQTHITKVTACLRARGHTVVWRYPAQVYTHGGTWCGPTDGIVVLHDYHAALGPTRLPVPTVQVFHGWEGIDPIPATIIQRRRVVAAQADAILNIGLFIPKLYGTPVGTISYGALESFVNPAAGKDYAPYFLWIGRFEQDNTPIETITLMCAEWGIAYLDPPRFLIAGEGNLKAPVCALLHERHAVVRDVTGPNAREYIPCATEIAWTGYLNALDATAAGVRLIGHYSAAGSVRLAYVHGFGRYPDLTGPPTQAWAQAQTWDHLADQYEALAQEAADQYHVVEAIP